MTKCTSHHATRLTVDEVITPHIGNCTIFARYVEAGFATQVILNARLTRFYEREDWKRRLQATGEPMLLERGISFQLNIPVADGTLQGAVATLKMRKAMKNVTTTSVETMREGIK